MVGKVQGHRRRASVLKNTAVTGTIPRHVNPDGYYPFKSDNKGLTNCALDLETSH